MGQLDEAIRAHLELKRKHGASEEQLHAEEQEALGPVRREPPGEPPPEVEPHPDFEDAPLAGEQQAAYEPEAEAEAISGFEHAALDAAPPDSLAEPSADLAPEPFHEAVEPTARPAFEPVPEAEEPSAAVGAEPVAPQPDDTPPRGFAPVEDEPTQDDDEEDVLEETPDFLQEAPEHDRLWFEQKPPRDFDFDE